MSEPDAELDLLFDEMANEVAPTELAGAEARRRQRAIGGMRAMHRSLTEERAREPHRRRRYIWIGAAAAMALAGTALAAARGALPFSFSSQHPALTPAVRIDSKPPSQIIGSAPPVVVQAEATPSSSPVLPTPAPAASAPPRVEAKSALTQTAELEEVNRLFVEAKRARREHRDADALNRLQQLLTKHPGSVLAHEASVERFRTLARLGRTEEAQRYARAYLARYPTGFAADEARTLLGANP
jgi:hypothetical protein